MLTKEQAIELIKAKIEAIKEEGPQDVSAWEYRSDCLYAIELIEAGGNIQDALDNI